MDRLVNDELSRCMRGNHCGKDAKRESICSPFLRPDHSPFFTIVNNRSYFTRRSGIVGAPAFKP